MARATRPVKNQDGIDDVALRIAHGLAERRVMKTQLRRRFARPEFEVFQDEIAFRRGRISILLSGGRRCLEKNNHKHPSEKAPERLSHCPPLRVGNLSQTNKNSVEGRADLLQTLPPLRMTPLALLLCTE